MNSKKEFDNIIMALNELKKDLIISTYIPKYFDIKELVDKKTYENRGIKAFELLDPYMLWTLDRLRERFGSITINNWSFGGQFQYSGFRPKDCDIGSYYSQHRLGRAFDLKFKDYTPDEIRSIIKVQYKHEDFKFINCVENKTPTWVHIDRRPIEERIKWIDP